MFWLNRDSVVEAAFPVLRVHWPIFKAKYFMASVSLSISSPRACRETHPALPKAKVLVTAMAEGVGVGSSSGFPSGFHSLSKASNAWGNLSNRYCPPDLVHLAHDRSRRREISPGWKVTQ